MRLAFWNIRGFHLPLKQKGVEAMVRKREIGLLAVLETKLSESALDVFLRRRFIGWKQVNNFASHGGGRILILYDPLKIQLDTLEVLPQIIHCRVVCKLSSVSFIGSFVYGFHSIVTRRSLWENLIRWGVTLSEPWLLMGDFNNILRQEERVCGADVSHYQYKDFTDCCDDLGLSDLQFTGCHMTWTNGTVWSKLDRVMANPLWHQRAFFCHVEFLPSGCLSDHSPGVVTLFERPRTVNRPFRFWNFLAGHEDFRETVRSGWEVEIVGSLQFQVCRKLKLLKEPLKLLNERNFGHIASRADRARRLLKLAQIQIQSQFDNHELREKVVELRKNALALSKAELDYFYQLAKCNYVSKFDKCTKFFHSIVKRNKGRGYVAAISKEDGSMTESTEEVALEFLRYFEGLLGTSSQVEHIDPQVLQCGEVISSHQGCDLLKAVSSEEIKDALFGIGNDKAPGPDGFSALFFKSAWDIIGVQFCDAVKEFFLSGSLLKQMNHTLIALVPKSAHANSVSDFRPIACCNVIYKVISKILAARLRPVLGGIIDISQSAFVEGRSMIENIHLVQELLRKYNRKRVSPRCLIKVDLRKAYDSVSWEFLAEVMTGLKFPDRFIGWIMQCVTSPSYSIGLNGGIWGMFKGKKGLRQGDPLSPFLFLLCIEYLSRSLKVNTTRSGFKFHPRCGKLRLSHLAFADDLMLMARGDIPSVSIIMDSLRDFGLKSGLCANLLKSSLFTAGVYGEELIQLRQLTGIPVGAMPFRYLGVPLVAQRLQADHFTPFVDKITMYINSWMASSLSFAGRAELIRSVLQGVDCFWLSIFPVPGAIIERVTRLCRNFLWHKRHHPVSWKSMCLPKSEGGLGFRDLKTWNDSLLAKSFWNIHKKKDTLWVRWVHHIYLKGDVSAWDWKCIRDDSPLLKRLVAIRDKICLVEGSVEAAKRRLSSWAVGERMCISLGYEFFRYKGSRLSWPSSVWNSYVTPKHAFTLWLAARKRLPTKDRLTFLQVEESCVLCFGHKESVDHLFFQCSFSAMVWRCIRDWLGISREMSTIFSALKWIKKEVKGSGSKTKAKKVALACTVYHIWNARNRKIFEGQTQEVVSTVFKIKLQIYRTVFALDSNATVEF